MTHTLLIVEDDDNLRDALSETLSVNGYATLVAANGQTALKLLQTHAVDLVLSDIQMTVMDGHTLQLRMRQKFPQVPVIFITGNGTINDAVKALHHGAIDYLTKPVEPNVLLEKIKRCLPSDKQQEFKPVAIDHLSQHVLAMASRVAASDATVLISGESGTGKEVLAHYIHDHSPRWEQPFIAINCAAIPESMLEATLFGYEKGAFTGAYKSTPGKFEAAQSGTLLLDEISEMDLNLQAKLLRVLQEREVERIGGNKSIQLDVRIIATTNRDMREEVAAHRFREDLFYRLNVFPLHWMPLRERRDDILPMAQYLLEKHALGRGKPLPSFDQAAQAALLEYSWPGNAREMDNIIQRALVLYTGDVITADDLQLDSSDIRTNSPQSVDETTLSLLRKYSLFAGGQQSIAEALGKSPAEMAAELDRLIKAGTA